MARFFVAWYDTSTQNWIGINSDDSDDAFDAANGGAANSAAAIKSGKVGKFAAFPIDGANVASYTTAGPANSNVTFTATGGGTLGNTIRIAYVVSGNNTPLSVGVTGRDITVTVATNGSGVATSTGGQVRDAVNAHAVASLLVSATVATGNDGTGVVAAFALDTLTGGTNGAATVEDVSFTQQTTNTPSSW
jgi:hypothetical protein